MPLKSGSDRTTVSGNISEMVKSGHKQDQSVAASLDNARRHPSSRKGAKSMARRGKRHSKRGHKR